MSNFKRYRTQDSENEPFEYDEIFRQLNQIKDAHARRIETLRPIARASMKLREAMDYMGVPSHSLIQLFAPVWGIMAQYDAGRLRTITRMFNNVPTYNEMYNYVHGLQANMWALGLKDDLDDLEHVLFPLTRDTNYIYMKRPREYYKYDSLLL